MGDVELPHSLKELLAAFDGLEDRELRADLLIETSERFMAVPESVATRPYAREQLVPSCQSEVYVWARKQEANDGIQLYFAVENPQGISARAMAVILTESFAQATVSEILAIDASVVPRLFGKAVTMGKGQGLSSMLFSAQQLARRMG